MEKILILLRNVKKKKKKLNHITNKYNFINYFYPFKKPKSNKQSIYKNLKSMIKKEL